MITLLIIGIILAILWGLGLITHRTMRGGVHVLLIIALILIVLWVIF